MDLNELMAVVDKLPAADRQQLQKHLAEREAASGDSERTEDEWIAFFEDVAHEFREGLSADEFEALVAALNQKSRPSEKGL